MAQRDHHLDVVVGEEPRAAVHRALVPVLVDAAGQGDEVALPEAQLPGVLRLKVVQGLTAGLRWGEREREEGEREGERETFSIEDISCGTRWD